ncbi:MAG: hypothetical protein RL375_1600 [Pseudomonadota bacterium]
MSMSRQLARAATSLSIGVTLATAVCIIGSGLALVTGDWVPVTRVPYIVRLGHPDDMTPPPPAPPTTRSDRPALVVQSTQATAEVSP